jgi:RNA polymerase sigma factor (sigma-70 family)
MEALEQPVLGRIAAGDPRAVADCMRYYGGLVWSLARRWSDNAADAEDAVQEIFIELWKSAARYDESVGSEAVFIAAIAKRRLIDKLRARDRRIRTETLDENSPEPADPCEDPGPVAAEFAIANRALAELDRAQQEILLMGIVGGMSHSEIAEATGKPLGTVKTQLRRGLQRVRALLDEADPGED